jgi:hypothetical protein
VVIYPCFNHLNPFLDAPPVDLPFQFLLSQLILPAKGPFIIFNDPSKETDVQTD